MRVIFALISNISQQSNALDADDYINYGGGHGYSSADLGNKMNVHRNPLAFFRIQTVGIVCYNYLRCLATS